MFVIQNRLLITIMYCKRTNLENNSKILLVEWPNVFKYLRKPASQSPSNTSCYSSLYSWYLRTTLSIRSSFWTYLRFLRGGPSPRSTNLRRYAFLSTSVCVTITLCPSHHRFLSPYVCVTIAFCYQMSLSPDVRHQMSGYRTDHIMKTSTWQSPTDDNVLGIN